MFTPIEDRLRSWHALGRPTTVDDARHASLLTLATWIAAHQERAELVWVCTHNSRRSHMAQLWAWAAAHQAGLHQVVSYSGGTEGTAFFPSAIEALRDHGFDIADTGDRRGASNPVYRSRIAEDVAPVQSWSKVFTDPPNPQSGFAAIMVCSSADEACPFVAGADLRISLPYDDPKAADGSADPLGAYRATSEEIGAEMAFLMQLVGRI